MAAPRLLSTGIPGRSDPGQSSRWVCKQFTPFHSDKYSQYTLPFNLKPFLEGKNRDNKTSISEPKR
jgi:hypothetical protein